MAVAIPHARIATASVPLTGAFALPGQRRPTPAPNTGRPRDDHRRLPGGSPMSKLAASLSDVDTPAPRIRKGPTGDCDVYGPGDLEDFDAVDDLRRKTNWAHAHNVVDEKAGVTRRFHVDKFRYHWRMRCWHWTPEQRAARS